MNILEELRKISDESYADFQCKLTPGIDRNKFIGIRVPDVRKFAKTISQEDANSFLDTLPHEYYDEDMLHGILISNIKDYNECIKRLDEFLPYVNNWAVCDIMSPKKLAKNKELLIKDIKRWIKSKHLYTSRFGIEMLMSFYLDDSFKEEYLELVYKLRSDEYYLNMMIAWFFATSLAKQWNSTIKVFENNYLDVWSHNKTIQKAKESYRITNEQKEYLNGLKR